LNFWIQLALILLFSISWGMSVWCLTISLDYCFIKNMIRLLTIAYPWLYLCIWNEFAFLSWNVCIAL
jgi:hypothetical protein